MHIFFEKGLTTVNSNFGSIFLRSISQILVSALFLASTAAPKKKHLNQPSICLEFPPILECELTLDEGTIRNLCANEMRVWSQGDQKLNEVKWVLQGPLYKWTKQGEPKKGNKHWFTIHSQKSDLWNASCMQVHHQPTLSEKKKLQAKPSFKGRQVFLFNKLI